MRAWCLILVVAAGAVADEGEGAPGKGKDPAAGLKSADALVRAKAIRALGREGDERAPGAARAALEDADGRVRAAAAATLVRLVGPDERALEILIAALRDPDWYTRWDACSVIGSLGEQAESAAPALLAAAADKDLDIAREAVNAALRVAPKLDEEVVAGLLRVLESDVSVNRNVILRALDACDKLKLAKDWLAREMMSDRHGFRADAARWLRTCGGGTYSAAELRKPAGRAMAVHELGRDPEIATALFVDLLRDPDADVRRAAAYTLSGREATETAPTIAKLLEDKDADVRLSAARALIYLKTPVPEAGPALVRLATEGDETIVAAARAAMYSTGFDALAALSETGGPRGSPTLRILPQAEFSNQTARLDELVASLEDEQHGAALVAALREKLAEDQDTILVDALGSTKATVRRTGATLLGHLSRDRTAASMALRIAEHDEDETVRAAASKALERLGCK